MAMKSFGVVLVATVLLFVSPCPSFSQVPGLPSLGDFGSLQFGNITLTPSAKIGYRATNVRLSFPVNNPGVATVGPPNWQHFVPLEVTIKRADLWVGSVGLEIDAMSTIFLFGEAMGNASRQIRVSMPQSPWTPQGAGEIDWDGSRLQWWLLDFGGAYRVRDNLSVLVGVRIDHFSVALDDPKDPTGTIVLLPGNALIADIRTKMWVPYLGVSLSGDAYEARFIWSPITSADVRMPITTNNSIPPLAQEASYTQFKSGWYVGFDAVYRAAAVQGFGLNVWASGSYSIIRGRGEEEYKIRGIVNFTFDEEATSTFATSSLAVGLSADLDF
jgi:hypothetical protein